MKSWKLPDRFLLDLIIILLSGFFIGVVVGLGIRP
jgi:hypothetical protein